MPTEIGRENATTETGRQNATIGETEIEVIETVVNVVSVVRESMYKISSNIAAS